MAQRAEVSPLYRSDSLVVMPEPLFDEARRTEIAAILGEVQPTDFDWQWQIPLGTGILELWSVGREGIRQSSGVRFIEDDSHESHTLFDVNNVAVDSSHPVGPRVYFIHEDETERKGFAVDRSGLREISTMPFFI